MEAEKKAEGCEKGTPNKATSEIKELARKHGPAAIERLAHLLKHAKSKQIQIAAARELLNRGYGKATQLVGGDGDAPPVTEQIIKCVVIRPDGEGA